MCKHIMMPVSALVFALILPMPALAQSDEERDFVPGEKAVFYDDYTDMAKGAASPHWKVRGGAAKLNSAGRLVLADRISLYPNIKALPKNFTVETDFVPKDASGGHLGWVFENQDSTFQWNAQFQFDTDEILATLNINDEGWSKIGEGRVKIQYGKLNRLAVWYQDSRIRMYVNDQRAVDLNQVELKPWSRTFLDLTSDSPVELGAVRIAESMADISQVLLSTHALGRGARRQNRGLFSADIVSSHVRGTACAGQSPALTCNCVEKANCGLASIVCLLPPCCTGTVSYAPCNS